MTLPPPKPPSGLPTFAAGAVTDGRDRSTPATWPTGPADLFPPTATTAVPVKSRSPRGQRTLVWYGTAAGVVLAAGLVLVLVLLVSGHLGSGSGPLSGKVDTPSDARPPLAQLCPPPTAVADPSAAPVPTVPAGPRTVDEKAGISYAAYGAPWRAWNRVWRLGTLQVPYGAGQHFVTETYWAGDYEASILSAGVPATVNDSTAIDLECTGHQVAADVRASYYPQPNTRDLLREGRTTLGGRPAWLTTFRLHFNEDGLTAKSELVGLALVDVGRPTAAVIYVSIPDTHKQWEHTVDEVLESVRPT